MKKVSFYGMMCISILALCMVVGCTKENNITEDYVDLGLSSGTKWKKHNEQNKANAECGLYTYNEAIETFGDKLPTENQMKELKNECQWSWNGSGYDVIGPNGKSVVFPAAGSRSCDGDINVGIGLYWSSSHYTPDIMSILFFSSDEVSMGYGQCGEMSVRLVQD